MDFSAVLVFLLVIVLFYAIYRKGDVRAGAKLGPISLFFEAKEPNKTLPDHPASSEKGSPSKLNAPPSV
jgi:hypothetical protein